MVRTTKGGRSMNPADAFRKEQRKKEIQRNKLERKYTREAVSNRDNPDEIRKQLQEIIAAEEAGPLSKALKLRKKVLQEGFEHAVRKRKDEELKKKQSDLAAGPGPGSMRPEDSRYYHPTLNPTGAPPPGKMAAGVISAPAAGSEAAAAASKAAGSIPLPKPPPLPAGPAPKLPPPPSAPPLPAGAAPLPPPPGPPPAYPGEPLPPPPGPPPGFPGGPPAKPAPLPPPAVPPPGWRLPPPAMPPPVARLPPPPGPPPAAAAGQGGEGAEAAAGGAGGEAGQGAAAAAPLPPPGMPPPGMLPPGMPPHHFPPPGMMPPPPMPGYGGMPPPPLPPPGMAPPGYAAGPTGAAAAAAANAAKASATITGSSTVVKRPLAQNDKALTSMVPASVRVRREDAPGAKPRLPPPGKPPPKASDFGFGLAPIQRSAITSAPEVDVPGFGAGAPGSGAGRARPSAPAPPAAKPAAPAAPKPVSADAQYQEFLATMRELGAV